MKLLILSDLHLELGDYVPVQTGADVIVLAGDLHNRRRAIHWIKQHFQDKPVIYVAGNHEFYGFSVPSVLRELHSAAEGTNICVLENESVQLAGWTFLGCALWTDFAVGPNPAAAMLAAGRGLSDYQVIRGRADWFQPEEAHGTCRPARHQFSQRHRPFRQDYCVLRGH